VGLQPLHGHGEHHQQDRHAEREQDRHDLSGHGHRTFGGRASVMEYLLGCGDPPDSAAPGAGSPHPARVVCPPPGTRTVPPVPSYQPGTRRYRRLTRLLGWQRRQWTDDHELALAIHGTVVGAAAMAAASLHGTLGQVVVSVLVTVLVYWAAEQYARVLSAAVRGPDRVGRVLEVLRGGWPMVEAAYTPLAVLVVIQLLTHDLRTGVLVALGVATLVLGGLGHAAGRRAGSGRLAAVGWGALSAGFGVAIILLKLLLH
jgi:hypothetical protein